MPDEDEAGNPITTLFMECVTTDACSAARRSFAGLMNAEAEDGSGEPLNWWQASNVHQLCAFLANTQQRRSEGMVLCDAPGLGKTLTVLSTIACSKTDSCPPQAASPSSSAAAHKKKLVIIFAGKGIVAQWAEQCARHIDPELTGLRIFCADAERSKFSDAVPLSTRAEGAKGGVYVDERPSAKLPEQACPDVRTAWRATGRDRRRA